jgi:hypothetical protein
MDPRLVRLDTPPSLPLSPAQAAAWLEPALAGLVPALRLVRVEAAPARRRRGAPEHDGPPPVQAVVVLELDSGEGARGSATAPGARAAVSAAAARAERSLRARIGRERLMSIELLGLALLTTR